MSIGWGLVALGWALASLFFLQARTLWDGGSGNFSETIDAEARAIGVEGFTQSVTWIAGIVFIVWLFQAYKSAESRGATDRKWGPGWTIGSWFIPIANWIIPKLVVNEIDRMSNRDFDAPIRAQWKTAPRLAASDIWWAALLAGWFMAGWASIGFSEITGADDVSLFYLISMIQCAAYAVAAGAAAIVVRTVGGRLRAGSNTPVGPIS